MTAQTIATPAPNPARRTARASTTTGTGFLLRFLLRRDWVRLAVWVTSLLAFCTYYVTAIGAVYPTADDRQNRASTMETPGGILLGGPGYGLADYTVGAMFINEMTLWLMVLLATMNILQIVRNTRAEEATGRSELVRALPIGRHAAPVAAFAAVAIADAVFAVLGSLLLVSTGNLPVLDTIAMMTGLALTGLVFAALATITSQLTVHPRGASGLAFAGLGAAVLARGVGDILTPQGGGLSWLSPIAWTHQTRAYVDLRVWPLGASALTVAALVALGAYLASHRDHGGALMPERTGPANATSTLRGPLTLAFRQQQTGLLWWLVGCIAVFGLSGLFLAQGTTDTLTDIADQNALTARIFGDDALAAFVSILMLHNALAAAVYAITAVLRIKPEEDEGRLGLALSRSVSRTAMVLAHLSVAAVGAYALLFVGGASALWAGAVVSGGSVALATLLTSAGAFGLGVSVVMTLTAALYAWAPRAATPLAWTFFGLIVVESFFGVLLNLPAAINALSPFWWIGDYPSTPIDPLHMVGLGLTALVLAAAAVAGLRRRDLTAG